MWLLSSNHSLNIRQIIYYWCGNSTLRIKLKQMKIQCNRWCMNIQLYDIIGKRAMLIPDCGLRWCRSALCLRETMYFAGLLFWCMRSKHHCAVNKYCRLFLMYMYKFRHHCINDFCRPVLMCGRPVLCGAWCKWRTQWRETVSQNSCPHIHPMKPE